jgi:hypothetical protein
MKKRAIILPTLILFLFSINFIIAEKISIEVQNSYKPGDEIKFKVVAYDESNNPIKGTLFYEIQNYYTDIVKDGEIKSGEEMIYVLPENSVIGYWAIIAKYNGIEKKELFSVGELEKADITIDGDKLVITNVGNVPYKKSLQIAIGYNKETILVPIEIGQKKEIKLTAPEGTYDIRVNDGTQNEDIIFSGVSLTGNVIGLEGTNKNFFKEYPIVSLFLIALVFIIAVIVFMKFRNNLGKKVSKKRK